MLKATIGIKKRLMIYMSLFIAMLYFLIGRVFYLQYFKADELQALAYEQQTRDRLITPVRGIIYDRNMIPIATNETVASISVINAQITEHEKISEILSEKLELDYDYVYEKVNKKVALERIKSKVPKETADEIKKMNLKGVAVDEDIKRVYPYKSMASQVIGFVGKDNQGIIGLEAKYDEYLKGSSGKIMTETDVKGKEIGDGDVERVAPVNGNDLVLTIDSNLQQYAEHTLLKALLEKNAKRGTVIMMNPQNGEILAMANKPDFDLNEPFVINDEDLKLIWDQLSTDKQNDYLNQMWRNFSLNDTYEPGSTFKIITSAAGMEEGILDLDTEFNCTGSLNVAGVTIRCWRSPNSHGIQSFLEGIQNSCNPVFMKIGEELGAETFYSYFEKFGLKEKTGIDLPGEAVGIVHELDKIGPVELATMSFGQSFQITPLQLLRAVSATINGGNLVTPHLGKELLDENGEKIKELEYKMTTGIVSEEVSDEMKFALESVVSAGTGNKTYVPGYQIGGKTATSEKLPRKNGKYIASFLTFAPADKPELLTIVLIDEPQGVYYGGQVAGPVMKTLLENALPYLNFEANYSEEDMLLNEIGTIIIEDYRMRELAEVKKELKNLKIDYKVIGDGETIKDQFPRQGEEININSKIILYTE